MVVQQGLQEAVSKSRKQIKERKNRTKKLRGTKKASGALYQPPLLYMFSFHTVTMHNTVSIVPSPAH